MKELPVRFVMGLGAGAPKERKRKEECHEALISKRKAERSVEIRPGQKNRKTVKGFPTREGECQSAERGRRFIAGVTMLKTWTKPATKLNKKCQKGDPGRGTRHK